MINFTLVSGHTIFSANIFFLFSLTKNKAFKQKQDIKPTESDTTTTNKRPIRAQNISDDVSNKNTQTIETAFVPCDSCARVQENLKKNADNLINILHFENLPSNLAKFRSSFPSSHSIGWLSANDTTQWLNEQDKDLSKLGKHLEFLSKNNEILKAKISEFEDGISKLTEAEKELKKQLKEAEDVRATIMKQYEKKLVDQKTELNVQISNKDNQFKQLNKSKEALDSQIALLNTIKQENEKTINELSMIGNYVLKKKWSKAIYHLLSKR
jgi:DNA repair exonuclease SbcCD ATPase subunit